MINFNGETHAAILKRMLDRIPDTLDKRDTSPIYTALSPAAWVLAGYYLNLNNVQLSAFVQTAQGDDLDMLSIIGGISRDAATPAVRLGVFNTAVPIGARFSTIGENAINFVVTAETATPNQYHLTAETAGAVGNDYVGAILPITSIAGLLTAEITSIIVTGADAETDASLRARLITALSDKPFAGNVAAYIDYIGRINGVGGVQVYPVWNGAGTVKCSVVGDDYMPISSSLIEQIQLDVCPPAQPSNYTMFGLGMAPIGATVTITTPHAAVVNIQAQVTLAAGYTLGQVQPLIEAALEAHIASLREKWAERVYPIPSPPSNSFYNTTVYLSQVTAAIIAVQGVVNVANLKIDDEFADLVLTESGAEQKTPILGTVTLYE